MTSFGKRRRSIASTPFSTFIGQRITSAPGRCRSRMARTPGVCPMSPMLIVCQDDRRTIRGRAAAPRVTPAKAGAARAVRRKSRRSMTGFTTSLGTRSGEGDQLTRPETGVPTADRVAETLKDGAGDGLDALHDGGDGIEGGDSSPEGLHSGGSRPVPVDARSERSSASPANPAGSAFTDDLGNGYDAVPRSVEPDREAEELAPEDALEPPPDLGSADFPRLQVRDGRRALDPEDEVELARLHEDAAQVHAPAPGIAPEGD